MPPGHHDDALVELASTLRATVIPLSRALRATDTGLTPTQLSVLGAINRNGPLSMGELADRQRLSPAMISRVVTSLADAGMVERSPSEEDRRVCYVRVSPDGMRWIEENRATRDAWLAERLEHLTASERRTVATAVPLLEVLVGDEGD